MAVSLTVSTSPSAVPLFPGGVAQLAVTIYNASEIVQHYQVQLLDFPAEFYIVEPKLTKLRPRETGTVQVRMQMPVERGLVSGTYVVGVLVTSPYDPEVSWCEELDLDVEPAPVLTASIAPEVVTGGSDADYGVTLVNGGNIALDVLLSGSDAERKVVCRFEPPRVLLEPGVAVTARLRAHRPAPLAGAQATRAITVTASSESVVAQAKATFHQKPRIAPAVFRTVGPMVGVTTLAGAVVVAAMLVRAAGRDTDDDTANSEVTTTSAGGAGESAGSSTGVATTGGPTSDPPVETTDPTGTPTTSSATPPPEGESTIDFTELPPGTSGDVLLQSDRYRAEGVATIGGVPDATDETCKDAHAAAQLTLTEPALGTVLVPALATDVRGCNSVPLRMQFTDPVAAVTLTYVAAAAPSYELRVEFADGSPFATVSTRSALDESSTELALTEVTFPDTGGHGISAIVFGGAAGTQPATIITKLTFTR